MEKGKTFKGKRSTEMTKSTLAVPLEICHKRLVRWRALMDGSEKLGLV
jgi:hypothetical protein